MDEYIKRQAALDALQAPEIFNINPRHIELIKNIPAADVAPVVHGRWKWLGPNRLVTDCMCGTCSVCKVRSKYIVNTMLCPNCGACMDGGDSNALNRR